MRWPTHGYKMRPLHTLQFLVSITRGLLGLCRLDDKTIRHGQTPPERRAERRPWTIPCVGKHVHYSSIKHPSLYFRRCVVRIFNARSTSAAGKPAARPINAALFI